MKRIASRDNPHFRQLLRLAGNGRERRQSGTILLDGTHLATAFAAAGGVPSEFIVGESAAGHPEIEGILARYPQVPRTLLADPLLAALSPVETPSGLVSRVPVPLAAGPPAVDRDTVLLDRIQDPGNVGSILRSAAAAGVVQVLLGAECAQAWSPRVLRAGMGAHFALSLFEGVDLAEFAGRFAGTVVTTAADARHSVFEAPLATPLAWIFGNEGQGVDPGLAQRARITVRIPMPGRAESLNVAAAAAICLFEGVRRRPC